MSAAPKIRSQEALPIGGKMPLMLNARLALDTAGVNGRLLVPFDAYIEAVYIKVATAPTSTASVINIGKAGDSDYFLTDGLSIGTTYGTALENITGLLTERNVTAGDLLEISNSGASTNAAIADSLIVLRAK